MISIVIPTVAGREDHLARCLDAYEEHTDRKTQIIVVRDAPTCGLAWREGIARARGGFVHLTADDLEPIPHWDLAAVEACRSGGVPAPLVLKPSGALESCGGHWDRMLPDWAETANTVVVPFASRAQLARIGPMFAGHYYTDNWFTYRARTAGYDALVRLGYAFTHHWAQPGRGAGMSQEERMRVDEAEFDRLVVEDGARS